MPSVTGQKIFRIRRDYNAWVANETLEDYALRYTPRSFRKWSEFRVANAAFGATSFLALEAIGGAIALSYGFSNALWAILVVGLITFLTGLPISYYAARHGVDMDLLTRGAGFGYLGSTLTSLIYASFTFIFFALEAAILALALQLYLDWPLPLLYLLSSIVIVPLVMRGITLISGLQLWTQPIWIVLFVCPFIAVLVKKPGLYADFTGLVGRSSDSSSFDPLMFGAAATVAFSLVVQIGEQVDYLRFLPEKTAANRGRWWAAVLVAGPGWIVPGMLKMMGGAFLAFLALQHEIPARHAVEPTLMYLTGFSYVLRDPAWVLAITTLFVVVSQMKINLTNAYAGSLAWSNFFARLTHSHPGRVVWLVFNVVIAILLMTLGVFAALEHVLGFYSNIAIAWVGALVADLVINKPLGWSPRTIEFKRAHLYDINPVGLGAMLVAAALAMLAYSGVLGQWARAFSPFIALITALLVSPLLAWRTRGRYYLARSDIRRWTPGQIVKCSVCDNSFESEDMAHCPAYSAPICSLCCTLESRCHDRCKTDSRAAEQMSGWLQALLPPALSGRLNFRVAHYLMVATSLVALLATVMGVVYAQEAIVGADAVDPALRSAFLKVFALLSLVAAVAAWWIVLGSESRQMAQEESNRHNHLLTVEIEAHQRTDAALQTAKEAAEAANQAKTRYVAGMTHELRTPLNSILGYSQILLKGEAVAPPREAVQTIQRSGEHMLGLIDGLLDLARIEAGRLQLEPAPLALPAFLDEVVHMVRPQAENKGLAFVYTHSGRLPPWVHADAKRLRQILINLLANAVRFTDSGTVTLHVDARREVLRFDVVDTGIGVAPQDHQRIFLPFERGAAGRRRGEPGTGLGLTITGLLTSLMGGELALAATSPAGSTFSVRVYLREVADPGPQAETRRPVSGYIGARRTLLVVDDQPVQRQMLAGMLAPLGFEVREAASGTECLDSLRENLPSAILLDLTMDDMDGWQTAALVRASGFDRLPIIIVSANMFENQGDLLRAAGCQAFVGKPVIESELIATLERHLGLEWLASSDAAMPPAVDIAPRPVQLALSEDDRAELMRLVQMGHVRGLHQVLDRLAAASPPAAATCTWLRGMVNRFELDKLRKALAEQDADTLAP
ncbi:signal transduction histidine kinase/CheY-like chemotaxis protein/purine-cytosine permease-like protein [Variovorax paradoxus]|uniref:histidine kinase n=1 Tax=Variovorax paradoxus TaxID=34073 RepID=A0AAE3Y0T4_VARPD|nr:ATP-binding protein [Variovorax paradoxus]MDP9965030.1 signal transduction histidine kinase/CheY-like chemotaxis protein/purine-cytosine permease-like protein [Variovorax paradoxus]MDR6428469.1 signal transduction histidine kinase/CheY-like chemotaxis protein/purine-cytosine permease-like protein [Variovorax paradoxus]MDR6455123.1 signal transduction histidine kinase/CheY-like chemotaxis protein/purine-cytosine permease-like protein [Variovorax paradoxus]